MSITEYIDKVSTFSDAETRRVWIAAWVGTVNWIKTCREHGLAPKVPSYFGESIERFL